MRGNESKFSFALAPIVICMLWFLKYVLMPQSVPNVQSMSIIVFGWVAIGIMVLPIICLVNEIGKNQGVSLEMINLIVIIALLMGCAYWALVVQGGHSNIVRLIDVTGRLI